MAVCKHVYYSGRVQGVGFRYTAMRLAQQYPITGFVRNLPHGDVELVAEGPDDQVEAFLAALGQRMALYIQQTRVQDCPAQGAKDFSIKY